MSAPVTRKRLSASERECLLLVAEGYVSPDIADRLGLSSRTVDQHVAGAMRKLGAQTRAAAAARLIVLSQSSDRERAR